PPNGGAGFFNGKDTRDETSAPAVVKASACLRMSGGQFHDLSLLEGLYADRGSSRPASGRRFPPCFSFCVDHKSAVGLIGSRSLRLCRFQGLVEKQRRETSAAFFRATQSIMHRRDKPGGYWGPSNC